MCKDHENNDVSFNCEETYQFLDQLGAKIWKILPLFEDKNEHLEYYVETKVLRISVMNSGRYIKKEVKDLWFTEVTTGLSYVLELIGKLDYHSKDTDKQLHSEMRSVIFSMTNLLSKVKSTLECGQHV